MNNMNNILFGQNKNIRQLMTLYNPLINYLPIYKRDNKIDNNGLSKSNNKYFSYKLTKHNNYSTIVNKRNTEHCNNSPLLVIKNDHQYVIKYNVINHDKCFSCYMNNNEIENCILNDYRLLNKFDIDYQTEIIDRYMKCGIKISVLIVNKSDIIAFKSSTNKSN